MLECVIQNTTLIFSGIDEPHRVLRGTNPAGYLLNLTQPEILKNVRERCDQIDQV